MEGDIFEAYEYRIESTRISCPYPSREEEGGTPQQVFRL